MSTRLSGDNSSPADARKPGRSAGDTAPSDAAVPDALQDGTTAADATAAETAADHTRAADETASDGAAHGTASEADETAADGPDSAASRSSGASPELPGPPAYGKPDAPGIAMNFDNTVALYHVVRETDSFEVAARDTMALLREAQARYPDWPRTLYIDIEGHRGSRHGFDDDFFEFQQELMFSTLAHFVVAFETPVTGPLLNPNPQRNDVPDELVIRTDPPADV